MSTNFKMTFFGGPKLKVSTIGQHILPGHPVHIAKVNMVRGEQLAKGTSTFIAISSVTVAIASSVIYFRSDSGLHGHGQRHTRI
jgi:hypothetical protein